MNTSANDKANTSVNVAVLWTNPYLFSWRCMQRTVEVCPYKVCMHSPVSAFQTFSVRSVEPLIMILSLICDDQTPPVCPTSVLKHWNEIFCLVTLLTELNGNLRKRHLGSNRNFTARARRPMETTVWLNKKFPTFIYIHRIPLSITGISTTKNFPYNLPPNKLNCLFRFLNTGSVFQPWVIFSRHFSESLQVFW